MKLAGDSGGLGKKNGPAIGGSEGQRYYGVENLFAPFGDA